jgi:hypothetical protein
VGPPGWLVGAVAAVAALAILGLDFGLFASGSGVLFVVVAAFWLGAGLAALIDPPRQGRNALIVAAVIVGCVFAYLGIAATRPAPPGASYGGANVDPPQSPPTPR